MSMHASQIHVVLGSGFGSALLDMGEPKGFKRVASVKFSEISGIKQASVQGHKGVFEFYEHTRTRKRICFQVGRLHGYEGLAPREVIRPIMWAFENGARHFILTNAAGGLKPEWDVGTIMLITDHVNLTGQNPLTGPNPTDSHGKELGPRFPDLSRGYSKSITQNLKNIYRKRGDVKLGEGVYLGVAGPSFETPAEVKLFASWGMGAVGMSTVWEAIALNHAGCQVGGLSLISNAACGLTESSVELDHESILEASRVSALKIVQGLFDYAENEFSGSPGLHEGRL